MNGRSVRSVLIRNRQENGSLCDQVPRCVQFDESSDEYRCLCNCFHVKTGAFIVAGVHSVMILFYLIHSLFVYFQHDGRLKNALGVKEGYVFASFLVSMILLGLAILCVASLILGVARNKAVLLIPHIIIQVLAILLFLLLVIAAIVAFSTNTSVFYRLLNAAPFMEHPGRSTVALDTGTMVHMYVMVALYAASFVLELWFLIVIYNCNRYLDERASYMKYCLAFSTPMKTLSAR